MIAVKSGVKVFGMRPEIAWAISVAEGIWRANGYDVVTVTSVRDGVHSSGSLHNVGAAVDLRSKDITEDNKAALLAWLKECLTAEFDVVLEDRGLPNEHYHIEFQPKGI